MIQIKSAKKLLMALVVGFSPLCAPAQAEQQFVMPVVRSLSDEAIKEHVVAIQARDARNSRIRKVVLGVSGCFAGYVAYDFLWGAKVPVTAAVTAFDALTTDAERLQFLRDQIFKHKSWLRQGAEFLGSSILSLSSSYLLNNVYDRYFRSLSLVRFVEEEQELFVVEREDGQRMVVVPLVQSIDRFIAIASNTDALTVVATDSASYGALSSIDELVQKSEALLGYLLFVRTKAEQNEVSLQLQMTLQVAYQDLYDALALAVKNIQQALGRSDLVDRKKEIRTALNDIVETFEAIVVDRLYRLERRLSY